jgi:hypothetical protein
VTGQEADELGKIFRARRIGVRSRVPGVGCPDADVRRQDVSRYLVSTGGAGELTPYLINRIGHLEWFPDGGKLLVEVAGSGTTDVDLWIITILGEAPPHLLYRRARLAAGRDGEG